MIVRKILKLSMDEVEAAMLKDVIENVLNSIDSGAYQSSSTINEVQKFCLSLLEDLINE